MSLVPVAITESTSNEFLRVFHVRFSIFNPKFENYGKVADLSGALTFPREYLSKFEFVRDSQLGMNSDIGYSLRDLEDPLFLMKSRIIDFSDTLPLINAVSHKSIEGLGFAPHLVS